MLKMFLSAFFMVLFLVCPLGQANRYLTDAKGLPLETQKPNVSEIGTIIASVNPYLRTSEVKAIGRAVEKYSYIYGIDSKLIVALIIIESSANPSSISHKGAVGLMQVMPYVAKATGFDPADDLFDIDNNIRVGVRILADNIKRWGYREGIERYFWGSGQILNSGYIEKVSITMNNIERDANRKSL